MKPDTTWGNPTLPLSRREFIVQSSALAGAALTGGVAAAQPTARVAPQEPLSRLMPIYDSLIDVNVDLFRWPLRRFRYDAPEALAEKLRLHGVRQAWAGSFEGLLHKDLGGVNVRLAETCRRIGRGLLVPFGSVNLLWPDWEEELRRCHEEHGMAGVRLHPNYHGYSLEDGRFEQLLSLAAERGLIVQLAVQMEDERMMHPRLRVEPVDTRPLPSIIQRFPKCRLVLLNALPHVRSEHLERLIASGEVYLEIATLEGIGGIGKFLSQVPASRVLFGSHAPLFYFESALLKLKESVLTDGQILSITRANADALLAP